MPTRIAVIGAGLIGRKHLGVLKGDPAFEVAGIADPAPQAEAYARENGFPYFKDSEALLDNAKPEGVVIANPNALHHELTAQWILAALKNDCELIESLRG